MDEISVIAAGAFVGDGGIDHHVRLGWLAPRFGLSNFFGSGTISASSEDSGREAAKAGNDSTWDSWKATGTASEWIQSLFGEPQYINFIALAEADFGGGDVQVQIREGDSWVALELPDESLEADFIQDDFFITKSHPDFAGVVVFEFEQLQSDGIRVLTENASSAPKIGHVRAGMALVPNMGLNRGWQPPSLNVDARFTTPLNEAGALLGRHVRSRTARVPISITPLDYEWTADYWRQFIADSLDTPFFMWWQFRGRAEAIYGVARDPAGTLQRAGEASVDFQMDVVAQ